jgi:hypothetical protein
LVSIFGRDGWFLFFFSFFVVNIFFICFDVRSKASNNLFLAICSFCNFSSTSSNADAFCLVDVDEAFFVGGLPFVFFLTLGD